MHTLVLCVCVQMCTLLLLHWIIRHQCIWAHSNCTFIYKSLQNTHTHTHTHNVSYIFKGECTILIHCNLRVVMQLSGEMKHVQTDSLRQNVDMLPFIFTFYFMGYHKIGL